MKFISEEIFSKTGKTYSAFSKIYDQQVPRRTSRIYIYLLLGSLLFLLLPWTQNVPTAGEVTSLYLDQRTQQLNSVIPGKIIKWWVKEGDYVKKGDTILQLADVKDDYLDPLLIDRTNEQLDAKKQKAAFYQEKIEMAASQIEAVKQAFNWKTASVSNKIQQLERKISSDSAEWLAADIDFQVAEQQLTRGKKMIAEGLIPLTEFEKRTQTFNKSKAILFEKQQKLQNARQEIVIAKIELQILERELADKIFKTRSEIAGSSSEKSSVLAEVAKGENQLSNYKIRSSQRWIIAPQSGQITKAKKSGINEMIKEGEMIVEIVPDQVVFAAALYVKPMDLVLLNTGQIINMQFDGYPAIVFSGWPKASYGTFSGKIIAIESSISSNGKFKILVVPTDAEHKWPPTLRVGTGVQGIALLKNVSIGYEIWRQLNGFPPDFYKPSSPETKSESSKK